MRSVLKRLFGPVYDRVVRCRPVRALIARELQRLAAEPFSAAIIDDFVHGDAGTAYGLGRHDKLRLVEQFRRCNAEIPSGTSPLVHIVLAREILRIPPESRGNVIECGVWKGASSAALSLVCRIAGRQLLVCDSFQGLPDDNLELHYGPHVGIYGYYKQGMFAGALEEVRHNIERCGDVGVCEFVPGFFAESLPTLREPLVFAFLDVDLVSSTRDCLKYIWPLLVEDGLVYTDDAGDMPVSRVYFDDAWWQDALGCPAPGLVGAGCGLPLNPQASSLGYTRKTTHFDPAKWKRASFLHYPDADASAPGESLST